MCPRRLHNEPLVTLQWVYGDLCKLKRITWTLHVAAQPLTTASTGHLRLSLGPPVAVLTRHPTPGAVRVPAATSARVAVDFPVSRSPRWWTIHNCQQNKYVDVFVGVGVRACVRAKLVTLNVHLCLADQLMWTRNRLQWEVFTHKNQITTISMSCKIAKQSKRQQKESKPYNSN